MTGGMTGQMTDGVSAVQIWALSVCVMWIVLSLLAPRLGVRHRMRAFWALIGSGVPVLGLLTLSLGPLAGAGGFAAGLVLLLCQPFGHRRPAQAPSDARPPIDADPTTPMSSRPRAR